METLAATVERSKAKLRLPEPHWRRLIRERARLSQADVARAIGVTPSAVSRWESGVRLTPRSDAALARYVELLDRLAAER
jgi:transcriptional regulator with XRE-family HTH domain